jgi:hypothetical protein
MGPVVTVDAPVAAEPFPSTADLGPHTHSGQWHVHLIRSLLSLCHFRRLPSPMANGTLISSLPSNDASSVRSGSDGWRIAVTQTGRSPR